MRYKQFKNAGVEVSEFAVGTWGIGELERFGYVKDETGKFTTKGIQNARNDAIEAIQAALDGGVNLIDTAPCYGNGAAEKIVGEAIRDFDRSKILISTKCGLVPVPASCCGKAFTGRDASYKNIMREVQSSLSLLGTDYIDFYFIHWPDPNTDLAETMSALNVLKKRGLIRYIGLSNHDEKLIEEAQEWGQIDVIQPPFSMVSREATGLMKWCAARGIDSLTYGSLGSGLLTGTIREKPNFKDGDIRKGFYGKLYQDEAFNKFLELMKVIDSIAEAHGKPVAQVAINWSTQQDFVGTALCGVASAAQAKENCATFDWSLSVDEMTLLNNTLEKLNIG